MQKASKSWTRRRSGDLMSKAIDDDAVDKWYVDGVRRWWLHHLRRRARVYISNHVSTKLDKSTTFQTAVIMFYKRNIKIPYASNDNNDKTTHNYFKTIIKCKSISSIVDNHQQSYNVTVSQAITSKS